MIKLQIVWINGEYRLKLIEWLFISIVSIVLIAASIAKASQVIGHSTPIDDGTYCTFEFRYGSINWTTGLILARGITSSKHGANTELNDSYALKSAKNSAVDHMVEILNAIGLPGKYKTSELSPSLSQSPSSSEEATQSIHMIISQIKKKAISAKVTEVRHISKNTTEVTLETNMYGDFLQAVLPPAIREIPEIELFEPANQYHARDPLQTTFHADQRVRESRSHTEIGSNEIHTGIIVDARDIGFKPVICPVIVSEQGEEIYDPLFISRKYAVERGVCSYVCSLNPMVISQRVGNNPLTIKGLRRDNDRNYSIVISMSDADKIQRMPERHSFMKECKVVIVISP